MSTSSVPEARGAAPPTVQPISNHVIRPVVPAPKIRRELVRRGTSSGDQLLTPPTAEGLSIDYAITPNNDLEIFPREERAAGRPADLQRPASPAPWLCRCCFHGSLRDDGCVWSQGRFKGRSWPDYEAGHCRQGRHSIPAASWSDRRARGVCVQGKSPVRLPRQKLELI